MAKFVEIEALKDIGRGFVKGKLYKVGNKLAQELIQAKKAKVPTVKKPKTNK